MNKARAIQEGAAAGVIAWKGEREDYVEAA